MASTRRRSGAPAADRAESRGFIGSGRDQVYFVLHRPSGRPLGKVLLVPPMSHERNTFWFLWVRWARFLARHGFTTMRFDWRGDGESTGRFESLSFSDWMTDLGTCLEYLEAVEPAGPVLLHGLRLGGAMAGRLFRGGCGDALLLWSAQGARDQMMDGLRSRLAADMIASREGAPRSRNAYIEQMKQGELIEVEGYPWSARLWNESESFSLCLPEPGEARPWHACDVGLPMRPFVPRADPMGVDPTPLFTASVQWVEQVMEPVGSHR